MDTVLFRDVVERYGVSQVAALRWLIRQCLRNPAGSFSVLRFYKDLKSQGHGIAKDAVHAMFGYLLDAFLISAVPRNWYKSARTPRQLKHGKGNFVRSAKPVATCPGQLGVCWY